MTPTSDLRPLTSALVDLGPRLTTLHTGAQGLRAGLRTMVKEVPGDAPVMDFIASDESLDRYNEVIKLDGWQLDNFRKNPVIPDCHDYSSIARILGRAQKIEVASSGTPPSGGSALVTRIEFCLDNPLGTLACKMARGGFLRSMSVGFIPLEWTNGSKDDEPERTYTKAELLEVSLVVVPANPAATIGLALKSGALARHDVQTARDFLECILSEHGRNGGQFRSEKTTLGSSVSASAVESSDAQQRIIDGFKALLKLT